MSASSSDRAAEPQAPRRRRARAWLLAVLLAGGIGGGVVAYREARPALAVDATAPPPVPTVEAAVATLADVPIETMGLGTVQPFNSVTVKPRVGGQIVGIDFAEGQTVQAGSVLARIDPKSLLAPLHQAQANLAKDEAQLDNVENDLGRTSNLAQKGFATGQALDSQKAQVDSLRAQILADHAAVENAQTQVDYATVTAPISGVAGLRMVDAGNVIAPSDPGLVVINQLQPIAVVLTVPAAAVAHWPVGQPSHPVPVVALLPGSGRELGRGTLSLVDNHIDPTTGTIKLKATFPNADQALKPGQFVNGRLETEVLKGVVTVPVGAVMPASQGSFVLVVGPDGTLAQRAVTVRRTTADRAVIASGLKPGETVVTAGQFTLSPGTKVAAHVAPDPAAGKLAARDPTID